MSARQEHLVLAKPQSPVAPAGDDGCDMPPVGTIDVQCVLGGVVHSLCDGRAAKVPLNLLGGIEEPQHADRVLKGGRIFGAKSASCQRIKFRVHKSSLRFTEYTHKRLLTAKTFLVKLSATPGRQPLNARMLGLGSHTSKKAQESAPRHLLTGLRLNLRGAW